MGNLQSLPALGQSLHRASLSHSGLGEALSTRTRPLRICPDSILASKPQVQRISKLVGRLAPLELNGVGSSCAITSVFLGSLVFIS